VCPDGSARIISWTRREGESERKIPHPGAKGATCAARTGR